MLTIIAVAGIGFGFGLLVGAGWMVAVQSRRAQNAELAGYGL